MKKQLLTHALMIMSLLSVGSAMSRNIFIDNQTGTNLAITVLTNDDKVKVIDPFIGSGFLLPQENSFTDTITNLYVSIYTNNPYYPKETSESKFSSGSSDIRFLITTRDNISSYNGQKVIYLRPVIQEVPYNQ